jgi:2-polyprenyl-6-hydroxyphenyl methylase/3-demethylubiquinone-9 3-methyltransferase
MSVDRPMPRQLMPDAVSAFSHLDEGPRRIHAHVTRPIVQQLTQAGAHHVLDLGCGNGWFTGALARCGFDVVGVDRDEAALSLARQGHPSVQFLEMDVTQPLSLGLTKRFDAVVAIDLVDHLPLPRRMLHTALAALKPGGILVVTTAYYGYAKNLALAATGRFDARWDPLLDEGRVKFFSRATLTALLTEFDLQELHFETIGRVPMFARSMLMSGKKPG